MSDLSNLLDDKYTLNINDNVNLDVTDKRKPKCIERLCLSTRHVFVLWSFMGFIIIYILRINLSMAMISMVNQSAINVKVNLTPECHVAKGNGTKPVDGKFDWDEKTQGIILGAFFWGYIPLQIPGGWLAGKVGGKWLFGFGVLSTSVLTLLSPVAAVWNYKLLIVLRIFEGFFESVTCPAMYSMLGRWSPQEEITFMAGATYSGIPVGTVVGLIMGGLLIEKDVMGGWPSVFYIPGLLGIVWFICWCFFGYSTPQDHPRISEEEKRYIETSINLPKEIYRVPWKEIFLSLPVWAVSISNFCAMWYFYITITKIPEYFKDVIGFSITEGGFVSSLPNILYFIFQIVVTKVADFIQSRHWLSVTVTRKLFNTTGIVGWAISMMLINYAGCNQAIVVAIFCIGSVFSSMISAGFVVNHLDLSPQHAGILYGIANSFGTAAGIIGPYVVGVLTEHKDDKAQWNIIFTISGVLNLFGCLMFLFFGSGERQSWAMDKSQEL